VGQKVSYAEALKSVEDRARVSDLTWRPPISRTEKGNSEMMSFSKVGFLAFIAMVINCTPLME
jgi:hypothetical protein